MKICRVCKIHKELSDFNKNSRNKDDLNNMCKECGKGYAKAYREKNYEKVIIKEREYYHNNKDIKEIYYNNNKNDILKYAKEYRDNNKIKVKTSINKSKRKRYNNDSLYRLKESTRRSISNSIKRKGYDKKSKTQGILGCSYEEFKEYIESQWEDWMTWDNYGNPKDGMYELNKTWDLDHMICISSATSEEEIIRLNHHTNFQPLCSYVNRFIKRDFLL